MEDDNIDWVIGVYTGENAPTAAGEGSHYAFIDPHSEPSPASGDSARLKIDSGHGTGMVTIMVTHGVGTLDVARHGVGDA